MKLSVIFIFIMCIAWQWLPGVEVRLKDMATFQGVRENQLIGYGVMVGLEGTGDTTQNKFTFQTIANYLDKMGLTLDPNAFQMRNTAAVAVTAMLPPFPRVGAKIDVTVSSLGSAKSIQGGILLITPLKGADGNVYAVAQGPISIGGYNASQGGTGVAKNHATVGRIPNGAIIEKEISFDFSSQHYFTLVLNEDDFTTTQRVVESINGNFGAIAAAVDSRTIKIMIPEKFQTNKVAMVAMLENLMVSPDKTASIVVNERTGTIVFGEHVKISTTALAHGNITVTVKTDYTVSQPNPFAAGETVVTPEDKVEVKESDAHFTIIENAPKIADIVKVLNSLGATPRDIIAILQAMKSSGALQAELKVI
jgi:flagellar P-ring protein precursor FlgI